MYYRLFMNISVTLAVFLRLMILMRNIREEFGPECLPINLPAEDFSKVKDCFFGTEGETDIFSLAEAHEAIIDQVVEVNEDLDYERQLVLLEEERELEIERLKQEGKYESTSWFWPFGGGPTVPLEADRKIKRLEQEYAELEMERERREEAESGGGWWIF